MRAPSQESSVPGFSLERSTFDDYRSSRQHRFDDAANLPAFICAVVHAHVMRLRADRLLAVRIEDHNVGIGPDSNGALPGKEAEDFRSSGRCQFDKAVWSDSILDDAAIVDEAHAVFDAGAAIRNLAEVVTSEFFLFLEAERAVVRGDYLQVISAEALPELLR